MKSALKWFALGLAGPIFAAASIAGTGGAAGTQQEFEFNTDRGGSDIRMLEFSPGQDHRVCAEACAGNPSCRAWTWVPAGAQRDEGPNCWLKDAVPGASVAPGMVSGLRTAYRRANEPAPHHTGDAHERGESQAADAPTGSITLFEGQGFGGDSRQVQGTMRNLDTIRFNDSARSLIADGRWEICEHADFQGYCTIVEGRRESLGDRLNGSVSSVRPVSPATRNRTGRR